MGLKRGGVDLVRVELSYYMSMITTLDIHSLYNNKFINFKEKKQKKKHGTMLKAHKTHAEANKAWSCQTRTPLTPSR